MSAVQRLALQRRAVESERAVGTNSVSKMRMISGRKARPLQAPVVRQGGDWIPRAWNTPLTVLLALLETLQARVHTNLARSQDHRTDQAPTSFHAVHAHRPHTCLASL